jgi:hypothetical protein
MSNLIKRLQIKYWQHKIDNCKGFQVQCYYAEISKIKYGR